MTKETPAPAEPAAPAAPAAYPTEFQGQSYADIARRWLTAYGEDEPQPGERHHRLLELACDLRLITENNPDWLLQVMPSYGLPASEMTGIVQYACQLPQTATRSRRLQYALQPRVEDLPLLPDTLPPLMELLTRNTPDIQKAAVAQAVFPALANYPYMVTFPYIDGKPTGLTLNCLLMADSAAGKGCVNPPIDHIMARIAQRDKENRKVIQQWKEEMNIRAANRGGSPRPKLCVQWAEPDLTNASLVQMLMDANGHSIYLRMDELKMFDALKGNARTNSQFTLMCLAFDQSPWGQERVGTQSVSGNPPLCLNWNASTTPKQGQDYFRRVLADGPVNRLCICTIPFTGIGADIPVYGAYTQDFDDELRPYLTRLEEASGAMQCPEAYELAQRLNAECQAKAIELQSLAYDHFRRRALVIAYRKACLLWLAHGCWLPEIEEFVHWSLQSDLACKMLFFGSEMEKILHDNAIVSAHDSRSRSNLLKALPETFTKADLLRVRKQQGYYGGNPDNLLAQWRFRNYIFNVTPEIYKKI